MCFIEWACPAWYLLSSFVSKWFSAGKTVNIPCPYSEHETHTNPALWGVCAWRGDIFWDGARDFSNWPHLPPFLWGNNYFTWRPDEFPVKQNLASPGILRRSLGRFLFAGAEVPVFLLSCKKQSSAWVLQAWTWQQPVARSSNRHVTCLQGRDTGAGVSPGTRGLHHRTPLISEFLSAEMSVIRNSVTLLGTVSSDRFSL